ncbi:homeodomain transcription factor ste12 [Tulasnella sp. 425]|nr:homeodomain transcription factor ste12 [Tulasnella sp. 425]
MDHHNALQVQHPPQPNHFQSYAPQASSSFHEYMPPAPHHPHHQFEHSSQEFGSSGPRSLSQHEEEMLAHLDRLKFFLATAPSRWAASAASNSASDPHFSYQDPSSSGNNVPPVPHPALNRFLLPSGEYVSCVLWNGLYHITGTDIVRALVFRFDAFGRPVRNMKKFEEGVFSDLRNLKPGTDACLEEPKSPFLDLLFKYQCIRTQKKQKVFYWFSVPHDRLFLDALERDLKREKMGQEPTTVIVGEPARSFTYDPKRTLFEQFSKARGGIEGEGELERAVREIGEVPEPGADPGPTPPFTNPSMSDVDTRAVATKAGSPGGSENDDQHYAQSFQHPSRPLLHQQQSSSDSFVGSGSDKPTPEQPKGPGGPGTPFFSMFSLFEGSPNYKQRRKKAAATTGTTGPAGSLAGAKQPTSGLATADVITGSHLATSESPLAVNSNIYGNDVGYGDSYDTSTEVQHSQSYLSDVGASADQYTPPQQYPSSSYSLAPSASHGSTTGAHVGLGLGMAPPATDYRHSSPFAPQPVSHHYHPQHPMSRAASQVHNLSPSPVPMGLGPSPEIISSTGMPMQQQHFVQVNGTMSPMHNIGHTAQSPAPPHPSHGMVSASPGMASGVGHFSQSPAPHAYARHAASSPAPIHDHTGYGAASALPSSTFTPSTPLSIQSASLPATSSPMNMGTPGAGAGLPGSTPVPRLKQFPCPLYSCGKTFKRMEHLKRHLRTHTMERPFACDKCGKKFSRSDNLTQHLRTHSKDSGELSIKDGGDFEGSGGENDGSAGDESDGMGLGDIDLEQEDVVGVVPARVPMNVFDPAGQVHNSPTPFTNNLPPSSSLDTWAGPSSHGHTGDYIPPHSQSLPVPITNHAESRASFSALHPVEGSPLQYGSPQQVPGALLPAHEQHAIQNHAQQLLSRSNRPRPMHTVTSDGYSVPYPRGASLQPPTMPSYRNRPDFASFGGDALSSSAPSAKAGYENLALLPGYAQSSSFHGSVGPIRRHRSATPTIRPGPVPQYGSPGHSLFAPRTQASHGYHPYLHRQSRSRDFSTSSSLGMGAQDDASQGVPAAAGDYGGVLDPTSLADASVNAQVGGSAEFYSVPSVDSVGVVDNASLYGLDGPTLMGAAPVGSPSGFLGTPDAQQIGV